MKNIKLVQKIDKTNYWFKADNQEKLTKEVHFYLYKDVDLRENICVEEENFDRGQWFTKDEAFKRIGFPAQRKILDKAFKMIENEYTA